MEGERENGERDKRKVGGEETGNDRMATAGWKQDTFIRLSAYVSVGNLLFFTFYMDKTLPGGQKR